MAYDYFLDEPLFEACHDMSASQCDAVVSDVMVSYNANRKNADGSDVE